MNRVSLLSPFFLSVFLGIISWILVFLIWPVRVVYPLTFETTSYVILCYASLILGYFLFPKLKKEPLIKEPRISENFIKGLIIVVLISFTIRYIDLFLFRGTSLFNSFVDNKILIAKHPPGFVFIIASVTRYLFFVPIIFLFQSKSKNKTLLLFCIVIFFLPFIEGGIRGSRNSFFYPSILLLTSLLYFKKIKLKKIHLGIMLSALLILFFIATKVLKKREIITEGDYKHLTTKSIYNDFLKPSESALKVIYGTQNETLKQVLFSGLQTGQYYTHGLFEFNHLIKKYNEEDYLTPQYGKFTLFNYVKLTNKYKITNIDMEAIEASNPRGYTFTTFFGGLFIDFGWFGPLVMLFLGAFQKHIFNQVQNRKSEFLPLFLFFLFVNFFMLTFNFLIRTGTSIVTINLALILVFLFKDRMLLKKVKP